MRTALISFLFIFSFTFAQAQQTTALGSTQSARVPVNLPPLVVTPFRANFMPQNGTHKTSQPLELLNPSHPLHTDDRTVNCTLLNEQFDNGSWATANWQVNGYPINIWIVNTATSNSPSYCAYVSDGSSGGSGYSYTSSIGSPAIQYSILYKQINSANLSNLALSFNYKVQGEGPDGFGGPYDYFELVYSFDATNWTPLTTQAYGLSTWQLFSATLPANLNNTNFYIGFRWTSDDYITQNPPAAVDNILLSGQMTAQAGSNVSICSGQSTTLSASGGSAYSWSPVTGLSNPNIANPIASPSVTTTYTVTVSNGSCSETAQTIVTVTQVSADAGTGQSYCTGESIQLSASGGSSYSWSPVTGLSNPNISNPVATPSGNITYTVTVSQSGCIATDTVQFTEHSYPGAAFSVSDDTIPAGTQIQFSYTGAGALQWNWLFGDGGFMTGPNPVYTYSTPGDYMATLNVHNFYCAAADSHLIHVTSETAAGDPTESGWRIYPQPADEDLVMHPLGFTGTYTVEIISPEGTVLETFTGLQGAFRLDTRRYPAGVYLAKMTGREDGMRFVCTFAVIH